MYYAFNLSITVPDNTPFSEEDYRKMIERAVNELPGVDAASMARWTTTASEGKITVTMASPSLGDPFA